MAKYYHRTFSCLVVQSFQFTFPLRDALWVSATDCFAYRRSEDGNVQDTENANRKPAMT